MTEDDKYMEIIREQGHLISLYQTVMARNPLTMLSIPQELCDKIGKSRDKIQELKELKL